MYRIHPETPADTPEVEALYDLCFAPGRTALSSYRLRDGVAPVAPSFYCESCVAELSSKNN